MPSPTPYWGSRPGGPRAQLTHVLEHEVDVAVAVGADDVQQPDDVRVMAELLQEQDLAERALRVGRIPERVEYLLQRHHIAGASVDRLPDNAVRLRTVSAARQISYSIRCHGKLMTEIVNPLNSEL